MPLVTVLGAVSCRTENAQWETLAPSARQLLAILVAAGPDGLSFERVADELWTSELPATWESSLRMAFTRLRKQLPEGSLANKARWCRLELPIASVDAWRLIAMAESSDPVANPDQVVAQLANEAFPNVEISPVIRDAIDQFDLLRSLLLSRLVQQEATISPLTRLSLRSFTASREWDTELADHVEQLTAGASTATPEPQATPATSVPSTLARHRAQHLVGRDHAVEQLIELVSQEDEPVAVVTAQPKSGRSATLAEVGARLAAAGWRIVHLEPSGPAAAFGPFLQAIPDLRDPVLTALASEGSDAQIRSRCWASILQTLDHPDLPTCVIVDDGEQLDSNSEEALAFIRRCRTSRPLSIVVAVDPASADSPAWSDAPHVPLEAVSVETIREMAADVHPSGTDLQQLQLSKQVAKLSGGRAGHASQLIQAADPETLVLPPPLTSDRQSNPATIDLSEEALTIAVAASILRSPISLGDLEHVTQREPHRVLTAVDELLGLGILTETSQPDTFEFAPPHQHGDFEAWLPPGDIADISQRAMNLPDRSLTAVAADAVRAQPVIGDAGVIASLLSAAESLVASQSHREAVAHFQSAEALGASLSAETLVMFATSLELVGADAEAVRERAVELALGNDQPGVALDAALAGLPRTERVDGDLARTQLIESIDPAKLSKADQLRRRLALSRQLLLLSRRNEARSEVLAANDLVETIEEEADVWLAKAHVDRWLPEGSRATGFEVLRFPSTDLIIDPVRRARIQQASAVSALIAGDFATAAREVADLAVVADESEDPLRIWHASLLRSAILTNELRLDEAERVADAARDHGVSFGIGGAVAGRLAQRSNRSRLLGEVVNTVGRFEGETSEAQRSLLARAAACMQLGQAGRSSEAAQLAAELLAASVGSRFEMAVAGLLSSAVGAADSAVREQIAGTLEPLKGTLLLVGAGITVQGPVESLLANTAADAVQERALRHEAVELVDSWESPLWQIVTRIELSRFYELSGRSTSQRMYLNEAADRAADTEFAAAERWGLFSS